MTQASSRQPSASDVSRLEARWESLTFADNYVFGEVLESNLDVCRRLLEAVLEIPIERVEIASTERAFRPAVDSRGVRLDVYAKDNLGRSFDVEMQRTGSADLARRARYYQAAMDVDKLGRGCDYDRLAESYVIFFCTFDPFGRGLRRYSYQMTCAEDGESEPWDGARHVYLNARGTVGTVSHGLQAVLDYLAGDNVPREGLVREIEDAVGAVLTSPERRRGYVTFEWELEQARREGEAKGLAEGEAKGLAEGEAKGEARGYDRLGRLAEALAAQGRQEELAAAVADPDARARLFEEFEIE